MKEVVAILSHADTDEKKDILKNCISEIKSQNYDIILSSHISVDSDILNSLNYFILDIDNPVVYYNEYEKYNIKPMFLYYNQEHFSFNIQFEMNHGYAVFKLISNVASICNLNDYQKIHFVNYDYIINDGDLLPFHSTLLNKHDVVSYNIDNRSDVVSSGLFSINTEFLLESIKPIKKIDDYFNFCNTVIFEEFLFVLFNSGNIKHISDITSLKNKNKIDLVHISTKRPTKKTGENLLLFLTKEKNNKDDFFLLFMLFDENNIQINIEFEDSVNNLILPKYKPFLVKVKKDWLNTGIKFKIPDYNYEDIFYSDKNIGFCEADPSILYDFDEFKNMCHKDLLSNIETNKDLKIKTYMSENNTETFYDLSLKNNTDKVYYHGYHFFYTEHFERFRFEKFNMLEIGYGDGASMRTWVDYFPEAQITVMDINVELNHNSRCQVIKGDQSNKSDLDRIIEKVKSSKLIIDDGSHNPIHQFETFNYLFQKLIEPGGIYIIEDIEVSYWNPESSLYGYAAGYFNLIDAFRRYQEMINSEFTGVKNYLDISSITFGQNCIIIKKRTNEEKNYFDRIYRFDGCVNGICHF